MRITEHQEQILRERGPGYTIWYVGILRFAIPLAIACPLVQELIGGGFGEFSFSRYMIGVAGGLIAGVLVGGPLYGLFFWRQINRAERRP